FPATGFVELVLTAAERVGLEAVEELTLETPLVLPSSPSNGGVKVQLWVGPKDETTGQRPLTVHARADGAPADAPWIRHATGVLGKRAGPEQPFDLYVWPPAGAKPVSLDGLYERLASAGLRYSKAFQGLRAVWTQDRDVFAEVHLPEETRGSEDSLSR